MFIFKKCILCLWYMQCRDYLKGVCRCLYINIYILSCRYFKAGGSPELVIQRLSDNYSAVAQTVNLLAEWLIQMGKRVIGFSICWCMTNHLSFIPLSYTKLSQ